MRICFWMCPQTQPAANAMALSYVVDCEVGVPYGSRTRVAAVKEERFIVIQRNFAAWIALYRTLRTHVNAYWTFNGPPLA